MLNLFKAKQVKISNINDKKVIYLSLFDKKIDGFSEDIVSDVCTSFLKSILKLPKFQYFTFLGVHCSLLSQEHCKVFFKFCLDFNYYEISRVTSDMNILFSFRSFMKRKSVFDLSNEYYKTKKELFSNMILDSDFYVKFENLKIN